MSLLPPGHPMAGALSESEELELKERPIGSDFIARALTKDQISLRKVIAKKIWEKLCEADTTMTDEFKQAYELRPPHLFYTDPSGNLPRRVFGVLQVRDEEAFRYHTCSAHLFWCNLVVGGCKLEDLKVVDDWTPSQKELIATCGSASDFLDPCGYFSIMLSQSS